MRRFISALLPSSPLYWPALRSSPRACGFPVPTPRRGQEMENAVVLREWFDRVDAGRTGNITAAQLQVRSPLRHSLHPPIRSTVRGAECWSLTRSNRLGSHHHQGALAVGNLNFPISVVQQMIRSSFHPLPSVMFPTSLCFSGFFFFYFAASNDNGLLVQDVWLRSEWHHELRRLGAPLLLRATPNSIYFLIARNRGFGGKKYP